MGPKCRYIDLCVGASYCYKKYIDGDWPSSQPAVRFLSWYAALGGFAKSRKYRGIFKVKSREMTQQVRKNLSQELNHKHVPKGTKPDVRKGKRSLLTCHIRCRCSMRNHSLFGKIQARYQDHEISEKSDRYGIHCSWSRVRMSFNIRERKTSFC